MFSLKAFGKSMRYAWRGLCDVAHAEQSFRIQLVCGGIVAVLASIFPLDTWERILLLLLVVAVLVLEIINSTLERLADAVHPRLHPTVRDMKDMMAGAVFLTALTALCIGFVLFFPHIFPIFLEFLRYPLRG